jgi:hypothetical protein
VSAVSSLAEDSPGIWKFTPTPSRWGSFRIELIADEGTPSEARVVRIFGIRTPNAQLLIPALNEIADHRASLINNSATEVRLSEDNATDFDGVLSSFAYSGWWRPLHELIMTVEAGGGGTVAPLPSIVYIDAATGNNANTGDSPGTALEDFDGLLRLIGPSLTVQQQALVLVSPHPGAGYDATPLGKIRYAQRLVYVGQGDDDITGTITASSVPTAFRTDFGSPGWSTAAYRGVHLLATSGANDGIKRTILHNTIDELWTNAWPTAISPGNQFVVTRPGVVLLPNYKFPIRGGGTGAEYAVTGCSPAFFNIRFNVVEDFNTPALDGEFYLYGVVFNCTTALSAGHIETVRFAHGRISSGRTSYVDEFGSFGFDDDACSGWGMSSTTEGAVESPIIETACELAELDGISAQLRLLEGSGTLLFGGSALSISTNPHGAIYSLGRVTHDPSANPFYVRTETGAYASILGEGGSYELVGAGLSQLGGVAAPMVGRYPCGIIFNGFQPTLTGQCQVFNGAKVRLVSVDGSTVAGGFQAGYGGPTAATFPLANDYISADDDSSVFRSA